jgi:Xaa-Pro aminopeptidase
MGKTYGQMAVDWEQRIDLDRLRRERLARVKALLEASELGALLCFDMNNIRYISATHIGTWAMDKLARFALLPQGDEPTVWDFGSAARHHELYCPWLSGRTPAGISTMRGAMSPGSGRAEDVAQKISRALAARGLAGDPVGVDVVEPEVLFALQRQGLEVADGQQLLQAARTIKTQDEISLLDHACMMVDAAYEELYRALKPGMRENECVGLVSKVLYDLGSEHVEGVNAISGERCSPHPHVYTDRALRPGDPAYFDVMHSHLGYRTCYYRTFAISSASRGLVDAYKRCRDILDHAISKIRPGVMTDEIASVWPRADEFGFHDEESAFALQFGHGVGLSIWERPIISRLVSLDHPEVIEEGMVFALETFWPATDGWSAARIEEELVVTADGCEVITRFPAEQLMITGRGGLWTAHGPLAPVREVESHRNSLDGAGSTRSGGDGTPVHTSDQLREMIEKTTRQTDTGHADGGLEKGPDTGWTGTH